MFSNLIIGNCSTLNILRIYGFYGGTNKIQITERPWGGQIRYSQLHSWNLFNSVPPKTQFLSDPAAQSAFLFCRRGENDDSAAVLRAERGRRRMLISEFVMYGTNVWMVKFLSYEKLHLILIKKLRAENCEKCRVKIVWEMIMYCIWYFAQ